MRAIKAPVVRWPGVCFADSYDWRDGIGPKEKRPRRTNFWTDAFPEALKHLLRQDPNVILIGEMRDLETIAAAITISETGHLVFATLHTQDAAQTIDRVIDVFPAHQQQQIRVQLAGSLAGVVCQTLCRSRDGRGRVAATEVLVATPAIRNLIREGKTHQIYSALQAGAKFGMITMDQSLADLVKRGLIAYDVGLEKCHHVEDFNRLCDRSGNLQSGKLDADSPAIVATKLKAMGYAPISINEANTGMNKELKLPKLGAKVKLKDLAILSRQFATMINSGLSLLRALTILCEQTENKELQRVLLLVRTDVETGSALSQALAKHSPDIFPPLMVNMIKAGEVGGFLDSVLLQVAENFESEVKLRGKVKSAMTYPVVVFIMAILMCSAMLLFIVPRFGKMYKDLGGELPAPTKILITLSTIMKWSAPFVIIGFIVFLIVWRKVKHDERVRNFVDPMKLRTPVFGKLFQKIALSRFARNLGTMMHSGVPILQSLDIVANTTGNIVIARAVRDVQDSVRTGESLAGPLTQHPVFPPMVVQMLAVGEDTEVEATTEQLTALIEPIMIAILGGIVGSMIIALYMPIFKIFDLIK